ncbi:MAG: hypothetical protein IIX98_03640 [Clostridia bacterium]|nr:hypothetical protein [Clostridia bacterium]
MFKKSIAILLALMMLFSMALPASAADSSAKTQENVEAFFSELLGGEVEIGEEFYEAILSGLDAAPSKNEVAGAVAQYAVVAAEDVDSVDALAQAIADDSVYTIKTLENGKQTIYIAVNVAEHPELFEMDVFRAAVYKICDKQKEFVTSEADFDLLTYTRFAGELYLHMRIYQIADPMADILGTVFDFLNKIVEMTGIADMNIDESRFPGFLFDIIGAIML